MFVTKFSKRPNFLRDFVTVYGPDGDAGGAAGDTGGNGDTGGAGGTGANPPAKTFTQADVDHIINARFKKDRDEKEQLLGRLKEIETNGLTQEAKDQLEGQIQQLTESLQTKEQTNQSRMADLEKKHKKAFDTVAQERDVWKQRFERSSIDRAIMDAASANQAEDPSQLIMMFGGTTRMEEQVDDKGQPTGNFIATLQFRGIDAESKKPVDLKMPVGEAISHMREHGLHKNLFKHGSNQGTGKSGDGSTGGSMGSTEPKPENYPSQAAFSAAYQSWRDNHDINGNPIKK